MAGAGYLSPPGCKHSGTRGNITFLRVTCGGAPGPTGRGVGRGRPALGCRTRLQRAQPPSTGRRAAALTNASRPSNASPRVRPRPQEPLTSAPSEKRLTPRRWKGKEPLSPHLRTVLWPSPSRSRAPCHP